MFSFLVPCFVCLMMLSAQILASNNNPIVHSKAGTYWGVNLPTFSQDAFLGIKYAHKPIRFTPSTLAPAIPHQQYNATAYGYDCWGAGSDTNTLVSRGYTKMNEDCHHLNIIRPTLTQEEWAKHPDGLPVLVWIYGGGWTQGATSDPRYNLSYIIQQSQLNRKPVIGVSINYRLAAFGFLYSEEVKEAGIENLGLKDQRVALEWIHMYIADFRGDAKKVTIWGESAGAYSVGDHINAYNGDSNGLFRAAIMESGGSVGPPLNGTEWYQHMYNNLTAETGCRNATDSLQCLREVPEDEMARLAYQGLEWFHVIDGSFIPRYGQESLTRGLFAKIPIIAGTNTDEGFGVNGVDTNEEALEQLTHSKRWVLNKTQAESLLELYPNDPSIGEPYGWGNRTWPEYGLQWKRYQSIASDLTMVAPRRLLVSRMSAFQKKVFSYRWDAPRVNTTTLIGVNHFSEIPYVFANPVQDITPLGNSTENLNLAHLVSRMWTSFAYDLDPNGHGVAGVPKWRGYGSSQENFVFRKDQSYLEKDNYRAAGMAYINSIVR